MDNVRLNIMLREMNESIAIPRVYVRLVGHSGAWFLAQCVYWADKMGGEFYRTQEDWKEDGFTEHTLRSALTACGKYITVVKKGLPAKNYYTVDFDKLSDDIAPQVTRKARRQSRGNRATGHAESAPLSIQEHTQEHTQEHNTATTPQYNPLGAEIIKEMEAVDPKNKTYYGNKTQREACNFLIDEYGLDNVKKVIQAYVSVRFTLPYCPTITSPIQLRDKWVVFRQAIMRASQQTEDKYGAAFARMQVDHVEADAVAL